MKQSQIQFHSPKNLISRCLLLWMTASGLCTAPSLGREIPSPTADLDPSRMGVAAKVDELALRAGVGRELRRAVRSGLRAWARGDSRTLNEVEPLLAAEQSRLSTSEPLSRRSDRMRRLRDALGQLSGRGSARRPAVKGTTGSIQGTLTDAATGLPLDFEFVEVYDAAGDFVALELTDEGDYTVEDLIPGTYFVLTDTSGHLDELYDDIPCPKGACDVTDGTPVLVTAEGVATDIDFELTQGGRILGSLTESGSGLPLPHEPVLLYDALGGFLGLTLTNGSGGYVHGGLATGTYYVLADTDNHFDELYDNIPCPLSACTPTSGTPVAVTLESDTVDIDFVIGTGGRILGKMSERLTGLPLDFEFVHIYDALGDRAASALTGSDGSYVVGGLPAGTYFAGTGTDSFFDELYDDIPCPGQECDPTSGTSIAVATNADTTGIDFVLSSSAPAERPRLTELSGLVVPVLVDLTDPDGRTTFFAVHNTTDSPLVVDLDYYTAAVGDEPVRTDSMMLAPESTVNVNVRNHLAGYDTAGLDQLVGLVLIKEQGSTKAPNLLGDTFLVDSSNDFASGDRLIRAGDLCNRQRVRFIDFGSGTEFKVLLNEPRGEGTPSFSFTAYNESGAVVGSGDVVTDKHLLLLDRSAFSAQAFGVLDLDFGNSIGGHVSATYSAFGRFSVDVGGECLK